ncbi:iron complex transport system substrate-binding protein [Cytobacillus firmus]|uniref:Iron complex transport system substrate-binding protein n=2 Tax=Cytobacillus TaxID=2675230 RepID=A0A366JKI7_CYTFI|nr:MULTISPECIES: ABC transporter substrate-binding protein [Cytobacillus]RBP88015.1 iron complex transport system substrate-binding protein [Cytobacillus firmus]TDX37747.1 iron complex transport system substrate-binding protein [Cytobacillus oceanisediminis]
MRKLYAFLLTMLLAAGVLAGCGGSAEQPKEEKKAEEGQNAGGEEAAFPVTIKDALDNEITIDSKPERIVSMIPSNTEIAFELGLGEEVVGVSDFDNYPPEATEKEKIGGMEFNVEKIISLNPDLVLAHASSAHNSEAGLQQLRDAGVTVLVVNDAKSFDQVYESIVMVGTAAGEKDKAEQLVSDMKSKLEEIKTKAQGIKEEDRKSVFVEVSPAPDIYTAGTETFMDEMLSAINAENIITEEGWPKMDPEAIIERNPDVIITTHGYYTEDAVGNVMGRDGWQDITAVKNKQVADVDSDMVTRSGPRIIEGVEELAKAVYPDVFK